MAPEAKLSKLCKWALVIDEQELRRLADECRRSIVEGTNVAPESIEFELDVQFSDGLSYRPETLDAVLSEENPRAKSISGLQLRAYSAAAEVICRLALEHQGASSIAVKSSERQWVYVTLSRIEERLRRMKQWYPRVRDVVVPIGLAVAGLWVGLLLIVEYRFPGLLQAQASDGKPDVMTSLLLILLILILLTFVLGAFVITAALFPEPVFRSGDGVVRHDRIKSIRSKLGWAILATCLLAPAVRVFSSFVW